MSAKEPDGSFMEADHLGGDVDMVAVMPALLHEQARRQAAGDPHWRLPFRPDHGHELLDDAQRKTHPGYPLIGRMRGLAELRGVMTGARLGAEAAAVTRLSRSDAGSLAEGGAAAGLRSGAADHRYRAPRHRCVRARASRCVYTAIAQRTIRPGASAA